MWRGATRTAASSSASRPRPRPSMRASRCVCRTSRALLLAAGFEGMERKMELAEETPYDLYTANAGALEALPASLEEAIARAGGSAFVEKVLSADTARKYLALKQAEQNRWFAARDKEKYQDEAYFGVL